MIDNDNEQQPLLSGEERPTNGDPLHTSRLTTAKKWVSGVVNHIRTSWKVYQAVMIYFVYLICYYGQISASIALTRDLTCARYYEQHPNLIDYTNPNPCSADIIETQSARFILICDLSKGGLTALSLLYLGKKFSSWGRKPLLLLGFIPLLLGTITSVIIPRGYPYGPLASESMISPTHCIYIVLAINLLYGLLGGDNLYVCALRILVVDNSSSAERTKALLALTIANIVSLVVGPLFSAAVAYLIPVYVNQVDDILNVWLKQVLHLGRQGGQLLIEIQDTPPIDIPPVPSFLAEHNNVTPFLICIIGLLLAIIYIIFFVEETASSAGPEEVEAEEDKSSSLSISPLRALIPVRRKDGSLDWRISIIFLSLFFYLAGSYTVNPFILYCGHVLEWGPDKIDFLLSSYGATRLITISSFVPACVIYFERTVRRPSRLRNLKVEEIHHLSKIDYSQETPRGDSAFIPSSFDHDAEEEDVHLLQGAISLWRARVDRTIVRLSWGFDIIGWFVVAIGALFKQAYIVFFGSAITGFASGGLPAFLSLSVTITSDVLSSAEVARDGEDSHADSSATSPVIGHGHAGEVFFSLLSLLESVNQTVMPIVSNLIYTATLSTFPAASFFIGGLYYLLAFVALFKIVIHVPN